MAVLLLRERFRLSKSRRKNAPAITKLPHGGKKNALSSVARLSELTSGEIMREAACGGARSTYDRVSLTHQEERRCAAHVEEALMR